eukprot:66230-Chlamydomonas_euryale.AAC.5
MTGWAGHMRRRPVHADAAEDEDRRRRQAWPQACARPAACVCVHVRTGCGQLPACAVLPRSKAPDAHTLPTHAPHLMPAHCLRTPTPGAGTRPTPPHAQTCLPSLPTPLYEPALSICPAIAIKCI